MRPHSTCLAIIKYRAVLTFTGWRCMRPHSTCLAIIKYRAILTFTGWRCMRPYSTCLAIIKYRAILTFTGWRCMRPYSTCLAIIKYRAILTFTAWRCMRSHSTCLAIIKYKGSTYFHRLEVYETTFHLSCNIWLYFRRSRNQDHIYTEQLMQSLLHCLSERYGYHSQDHQQQNSHQLKYNTSYCNPI